MAKNRGPKDHINIRILHSGSKAQENGDSRNHCLQDPYYSNVLLYHTILYQTT